MQFGSGRGTGNCKRVARHQDESATAAQRNHVWNLVRSNQANVKRWRLLEAGCVREMPTPSDDALHHVDAGNCHTQVAVPHP
jgi:hypothetical protein